jgi:hypothetical protein
LEMVKADSIGEQEQDKVGFNLEPMTVDRSGHASK